MQTKWPNGARCVVNITVDFDGLSNETGKKLLPIGKYSHGRYSAKRGVPRFLSLFDELGIKVTFFVPGYDAECFPDSVRAIVRAGHEIGAHGYLHEAFDLGDEEPFYLRKSHTILTELLGTPPVGWRNPGGGKSDKTIKVLRELGYIYDSSEKAADWPYYQVVDGNRLTDFVNLPDNTSSLDDAPFYRDSMTPPSEVRDQWMAEFDTAYREFGYYDLIVHPRSGFGSGGPARAKALKDTILYIQSHPGVLFQRQVETARWCLRNPLDWPERTHPWSGKS